MEFSLGVVPKAALGIEATGSHVPHGSQDQGHAAFMPDAIVNLNPAAFVGEVRASIRDHARGILRDCSHL